MSLEDLLPPPPMARRIHGVHGDAGDDDDAASAQTPLCESVVPVEQESQQSTMSARGGSPALPAGWVPASPPRMEHRKRAADIALELNASVSSSQLARVVLARSATAPASPCKMARPRQQLEVLTAAAGKTRILCGRTVVMVKDAVKAHESLTLSWDISGACNVVVVGASMRTVATLPSVLGSILWQLQSRGIVASATISRLAAFGAVTPSPGMVCLSIAVDMGNRQAAGLGRTVSHAAVWLQCGQPPRLAPYLQANGGPAALTSSQTHCATALESLCIEAATAVWCAAARTATDEADITPVLLSDGGEGVKQLVDLQLVTTISTMRAHGVIGAVLTSSGKQVLQALSIVAFPGVDLVDVVGRLPLSGLTRDGPPYPLFLTPSQVSDYMAALDWQQQVERAALGKQASAALALLGQVVGVNSHGAYWTTRVNAGQYLSKLNSLPCWAQRWANPMVPFVTGIALCIPLLEQAREYEAAVAVLKLLLLKIPDCRMAATVQASAAPAAASGAMSVSERQVHMSKLGLDRFLKAAGASVVAPTTLGVQPSSVAAAARCAVQTSAVMMSKISRVGWSGSWTARWRGQWWTRLVLNLDTHLKLPEEAYQCAAAALEDPCVQGGDQLGLQARALKLWQRLNLDSTPPRGPDKLASGGAIHVRAALARGAEASSGRTLFRGWRRQPMRVEDFSAHVLTKLYTFPELVAAGQPVLVDADLVRVMPQHWRALHTENRIWRVLFWLCFWNELHHNGVEVCDSWRHPWQLTPLDYDTPMFAARRQHLIEARLTALRSMNGVVLAQEVSHAWSQFAVGCDGVVRSDWVSLEDLSSLVAAAGGGVIAAILAKWATDLTTWCVGLPDLVVWVEGCDVAGSPAGELPISQRFGLVEVKGPGDSLSLQQQAWLLYLHKAAVPAVVMYVHGA